VFFAATVIPVGKSLDKTIIRKNECIGILCIAEMAGFDWNISAVMKASQNWRIDAGASRD
jgi:hypothetical protein